MKSLSLTHTHHLFVTRFRLFTLFLISISFFTVVVHKQSLLLFTHYRAWRLFFYYITFTLMQMLPFFQKKIYLKREKNRENNWNPPQVNLKVSMYHSLSHTHTHILHGVSHAPHLETDQQQTSATQHWAHSQTTNQTMHWFYGSCKFFFSISPSHKPRYNRLATV